MKKFGLALACAATAAVIAADGFLLYNLFGPAQTEAASAETTPAVSHSLQISIGADVPSAVVSPSETAAPSVSPSAEPTAATSVKASAEPASAAVQQTLGTMTLEEKICQLFFVTPEVLTGVDTANQAGNTTREALAAYPVGGVIYFAKNLQTAAQTTEMLKNTQIYAKEAGAGIPVFLGVDEEGGTVARVADKLGTTKIDSMQTYGEAGDESAVEEVGKTLAADISQFGFNLDFAPVADVLVSESSVIGSRSFGSDPALVSKLVAAEVKGLKEGGVISCLKHFPGHGATSADTHTSMAITARTLDEMRSCELLPFSAGIAAGAPFVMVGHMTAVELENAPCSMSSAVVTELLRDELGFDGVVITDALDMAAVTSLYTPGEAAVTALEAGCDMLLCTPDFSAAFTAVKEAVADGTLTEARIDESVTRILSAKEAYGLLS